MSGRSSKKTNIAPANQTGSSTKNGNTMENYIVKEGTGTGDLPIQATGPRPSRTTERNRKLENTQENLTIPSDDSSGKTLKDIEERKDIDSIGEDLGDLTLNQSLHKMEKTSDGKSTKSTLRKAHKSNSKKNKKLKPTEGSSDESLATYKEIEGSEDDRSVGTGDCMDTENLLNEIYDSIEKEHGLSLKRSTPTRNKPNKKNRKEQISVSKNSGGSTTKDSLGVTGSGGTRDIDKELHSVITAGFEKHFANGRLMRLGEPEFVEQSKFSSPNRFSELVDKSDLNEEGTGGEIVEEKTDTLDLIQEVEEIEVTITGGGDPGVVTKLDDSLQAEVSNNTGMEKKPLTTRVKRPKKTAAVRMPVRRETLNPYVLVPSAENVVVSSVSLRTKYLLVSRLPEHSSYLAIKRNLETVGYLLNRRIDMDEFKARFEINKGIFLKNNTKMTLLVMLTEEADFHTLGTREGPSLPLFFFTQQGLTRWETNWRVAVQAVSLQDVLDVKPLFEVAAIRGFPDCCHSTSTLFPIILRYLQEKITVEFLPIFTTVPIVRRHGTGEEVLDLRVEELILRIYIKNSTNNQRGSIRENLHSSMIPGQLDLGSWVGQIANGNIYFEGAPTNTPELLHTSFVLFIEGLSGVPRDDIDYLQKYFSSGTEFAAIGYIRGAIDSPLLYRPADVLLLFPSSTGGGMIDFDDKKWEHDHSPGQLGRHVLLPGFISLHKNYLINPFVPERGHDRVVLDERRRPGGAFVQELVRWDAVQEVIPITRSGESSSMGRMVTGPPVIPVTTVALTSNNNTLVEQVEVEALVENRVVVTKGYERSTEVICLTKAEKEAALRFEEIERNRQKDKEEQDRRHENQEKRNEEQEKKNASRDLVADTMMKLLLGLTERMDASFPLPKGDGSR